MFIIGQKRVSAVAVTTPALAAFILLKTLLQRGFVLIFPKWELEEN